MREAIRLAVFVLWCGLIASCAMPAQDSIDSVDRLLEELVALEPSTLDRWIQLASRMTAASPRWMFERGNTFRAGLEEPPRRYLLASAMGGAVTNESRIA